MAEQDKRIDVIKGDITDMDTDAIVNAANNHLWMGAGVAGAIKRRGGQIIEDEAMRQGPVEVGQAVITSGGNLKAKYVIHAAGMGQDLRTDASKIREATINSLRLAEEKALESIAFPAIGTGVGGFPMDKAAEIMIDEARKFLKTARHLKRIVFVLFDDYSYRIFKDEMSRAENAG
ncbi:MAG: macro domain-containing protein [Calditrichaeota bacterium]|nr:macro domain-containing protein [Calditrichota bacterium]